MRGVVRLPWWIRARRLFAGTGMPPIHHEAPINRANVTRDAHEGERARCAICITYRCVLSGRRGPFGELTGLDGWGGVADEAAGLLEGLGGFGEEAPEDVEVVGVDGEDLETRVDAAVLGVIGQL